MNQRKHLTLVAGAAALLAALPLATVFERWTWLMDSFIMVVALCGTAVVVRSLRAPIWAPTLAMLATYLIVLTWLFPSDGEAFALIPTPDTFSNFNTLLSTAAAEMSEFSAPVEDRKGFLFLVTLGIGGVAIIIDFFAVVLRKPALAGLPMLAIYSVPVAVEENSVSLVPFALGAAGFLWLLVTDNVDRVRRFGRRFTGDGRDVDLWEPSPLAAAGQRLGLIGLALAVILPLAVPGMTTGLLDRFGGGGGAGATNGRPGSGKSVSLFAILNGALNRDEATDMLRVTTNDPAPFYVRIGVADELTTAGFRSTALSAGQAANQPIPPQNYSSSVTQKPYKATFEMLNLDIVYLPIYTQPTKVIGVDNSWVYDTNTSTVYSGRNTTKKAKKYTVEFAKPEFTADALRTAQPLASNNPLQQQFSRVPARVELVQKTVADATQGKLTQYDKVRGIFDTFSTANGYSYSLSTGPETSGSQIVDFLSNKKGFCVQYAAAMGWLVRQAGIPARVAFGFTRGSTPQGNTLTLTNFNLHAWTEVYFQGFGWVPFDPTPATAIGGSVSPLWAPNPSRPTEIAPDDGPLPDVSSSAGPGTSAAPVAPGQGGDNSTGSDAANSGQTSSQWPIWALLGTIGLLVLLLAPTMARRNQRRKRLRFRVPATGGLDPNAPPGTAAVVTIDDTTRMYMRQQAHHAWDELLDTMVDYKVPVDAAETPRVTAERLVTDSHLAEPAAGGVRVLGSAEERARYARQPLDSAELRQSLSSVRGALRGKAKLGTRLMAILMPPSVSRRWRSKSFRWFTDTVNGIARRRDQVVRTLSVRRMMSRRATR